MHSIGRILKSISILLGVAAVSTGAFASAQPTNNIAVQMYTLRDVGTVNEQFAMAHDAGFKSVELVGTQDLSSHEMNRLLKLYDLNVMAAHVQLTELQNNLDQVVAFNKAIHNRIIIMPWLDSSIRPTNKQGWQALGKELDRIGAKLKKHNMTLAYHNHDFEMKKFDGKTALEVMLDAAKNGNVKLEMDAAWVSRGGQDPVAMLHRLAGHVITIHVKDNSGIGTHDDERNFTVAGQGLLSWNDILLSAKAVGVKWFVVEHDLPKDPRSVITQANQFLQENL